VLLCGSPSRCGVRTAARQQIVESASQLNVYAYDAYLIRCAEKYRCPLLTLDHALRLHAQTYGVSTVEVPT
jgi:predicted nucleic acid-binding protein